MSKRGIDISTFQTDIILDAVKDDIDFVIIRAGYGGNHIDDAFKKHADNCLRLGIPFGFYWYSYAFNTSTAIYEAESFAEAIAPYKDKYTYGAWLDMEDADSWKRNHGMPSDSALQDICEAFCLKMEEKGYYTGIYASSSWFKNKLNNSKLNRFDKWVAHWPTYGNGNQKGLDTDPAGENADTCGMWQFTSQAKFNGYSGRLDASYAYKDYPSIIRGIDTIPSTPTSDPTGSTMDLVYRTMKDEFGKGAKRKENLGGRYDEVQNEINHIQTASVQTLVDEVYARKYGDGEYRRTILGDRYDEVQDAINKKDKPQYKTYKIQPGDTLSGIANKFGTSVSKLASINNISNPNKIYAGQVIKIA